MQKNKLIIFLTDSRASEVRLLLITTVEPLLTYHIQFHAYSCWNNTVLFEPVVGQQFKLYRGNSFRDGCGKRERSSDESDLHTLSRPRPLVRPLPTVRLPCQKSSENRTVCHLHQLHLEHIGGNFNKNERQMRIVLKALQDQ